jgi:hypothetical protein
MLNVRVLLPIAVVAIVIAVVLGNVVGAFAAGNAASTASANGRPFKILRAYVDSDGTVLDGGGGMTITWSYLNGTTNYTVTFPAGTWNQTTKTGTAQCSFIPIVQTDGTVPFNITSWTANSDGSGVLNFYLGLGSSGDKAAYLLFTSANC